MDETYKDAEEKERDSAPSQGDAGYEPRKPAGRKKPTVRAEATLSDRPAESIYRSLLAVQTGMEPIRPSGFNPFHKSSYATLTDVMSVLGPRLAANNIVLMQGIGPEGLTTTLTHVVTGEQISTHYPLDVRALPAQQAGSLISYARRYSITALCACTISGEDDDAEVASGRIGCAKTIKAVITDQTGASLAGTIPQGTPVFYDTHDPAGDRAVKGAAVTTQQQHNAPAANIGGIISPKQLAALHATRKENGWPTEAMKDLLAGKGYDSSKKIQPKDYDIIMAVISKPYAAVPEQSDSNEDVVDLY